MKLRGNRSFLRPLVSLSFVHSILRGADWIDKTIKKKRIRQGPIISPYSEIHEDDNDLILFILETKDDPSA